jgi:hypothetical protein
LEREPVVAMRTWWLAWRGNEPLLLPVVAGARPWPTRRPARAVCRRHRRHPVPAADCACGLHATDDEGRLRRTRTPGVVGTVALWGRVVQHDRGYRAELAYPQRLRLTCFLCVVDQGLESARPSFVARVRRGRLVPLCEAHLALAERYDFPIAGVLDGRMVERALLDAYAVDPLGV